MTTQPTLVSLLALMLMGVPLEARFAGNGRDFVADRAYRLIPVAEDRFLVDGPAEDVIQFDRRAGRIVAITLNPGPWSQSANRVPATRE